MVSVSKPYHQQPDPWLSHDSENNVNGCSMILFKPGYSIDLQPQKNATNPSPPYNQGPAIPGQGKDIWNFHNPHFSRSSCLTRHFLPFERSSACDASSTKTRWLPTWTGLSDPGRALLLDMNCMPVWAVMEYFFVCEMRYSSIFSGNSDSAGLSGL